MRGLREELSDECRRPGVHDRPQLLCVRLRRRREGIAYGVPHRSGWVRVILLPVDARCRCGRSDARLAWLGKAEKLLVQERGLDDEACFVRDGRVTGIVCLARGGSPEKATKMSKPRLFPSPGSLTPASHALWLWCRCSLGSNASHGTGGSRSRCGRGSETDGASEAASSL